MSESRLNPRGPGVRWFPLLLWACKSTKGKRPRYRRAVRYLAQCAIKAEVAVYLWRQGPFEAGR